MAALVAGDTWIGVDRQGYGFFDLDVSDDSEFFPSSADRRCRFLETVPLAKQCLGAGS